MNRYFSKVAIFVIGVFSGAFGVAYALGKNYRVLGENDKTTKIYLCGLLYFCFILADVIFGFSDALPQSISRTIVTTVALVPAMVGVGYFSQYQLAPIAANPNLMKARWYSILGVSFTFLILTVALGVGLLMGVQKILKPYSDIPFFYNKTLVKECQEDMLIDTKTNPYEHMFNIKKLSACLREKGNPGAVAMADCTEVAIKAYQFNANGDITNLQEVNNAMQACWKEKAPKLYP